MVLTPIAEELEKHEQHPELWSSEELDFWHRVVAVYMGVLPELERDLQKAGKVSFFEFQVLDHLSAIEGSMSMSQLATRCNSSLSRLSHVAQKLENRRLLVRRLSAEDKRVTVAQLTPAGSKLLESLRDTYRTAVETRVLQSLSSDELRQVTGLLDNMLRKHEPNHWLFNE